MSRMKKKSQAILVNMAKKITKIYRKAFGHKSPFRRTYGSRTAGQAIGVTYRQGMTVAKDLAKLKAEVSGMKKRQNVEKNYVDKDVDTITFGQVTNSAEGAQYIDITPSIPQGDGQGNRHGNSLKLTGISIPMSFVGQQDCKSDRKIVVSLLKVKSADNNVTAAEAFDHYWDLNPLNFTRDANAPRNYRNASHDGISLIRQKTYRLKAPALSETGTQVEASHFTAKLNVSLQDVLRYAANVNTTPTGIKYILCFQTDAGNNGTVPSSKDVPIIEPYSGVQVRISQRSWYVDN